MKFTTEDDKDSKDRTIYKLTELTAGMESRRINFKVKLIGMQDLESYTKSAILPV